MSARLRVCSTPRCPTLHPDGGKCPTCRGEAEQRRGDASARGYARAHQRFRAAVLERDPVCVLCGVAPSLVADHHPLSRRELVERGADPNDPAAGRGLCRSCDSRQTAQRQPGGWNRR